MDAFTAVTILAYVCMPISLFLNALLMLVVSRYSTKYLIPYRLPLVITAAANAVLAIFDMLSQHAFVLRGQILFIFILGPARFAPRSVYYVVEFINVALFLFTCHQAFLIFLFRYHFIFSTKKLSDLRIYLGAVGLFTICLIVSFLYLLYSSSGTASSHDEDKFLRWAKNIRRTSDPTYLAHQVDSTAKMSSLIFFMYQLIGFIGVYVLHELICYRLKSSKHAVSHSRTLQMARAIIVMVSPEKKDQITLHWFNQKTIGTGIIGFLPHSVLLLSVVFDVELSVWAIPISLGSAFIPIVAPLIMFYKVDAYRSSVRALIIEFYHRHNKAPTTTAKVDQRLPEVWPAQ